MLNALYKIYAGTNKLKLISKEIGKQMQIKRRVRKEFILLPLLLYIFSEAIFERVSKSEKDGIIFNGRVIKNIKFRDDTIFIASTADELKN